MAKKKAKTKKRQALMKVDTKLKLIAEDAIIIEGDEGDDLDHLYSIFDATDEDDIEGIMNGSVGEEQF